MNDNLSQTLTRLREFENQLPKINSPVIRELLRPDVYPDDILPFDLYRDKRDNITRIGDQINKAFYFGIYDGCAVLMRCLIEMLLVLTFKKQKIDYKIRDVDGNYKDLSVIIKIAKSEPLIDLTRYAKEYLESFREKGNLSAHNIFYNARKKDLEIVQANFRALVEELFYTAGITN